MTPARLRRLQWAVRLTLTLGVAASVTANILHARQHPISQAIAAWPPVALLITVELVSRIPLYRRSLGVLRIAATAAIAGIAAWVSYWHMVGVVARYGETGTVPYLLPLSVDGLIIVASVSLVELSARLRDTSPGPAAASATEPTPASTTGPVHRALTGDSPAVPAPADQRSAVPADQAPAIDPPTADPATSASDTDVRPEPSPDLRGVDDTQRADADDPDDEDDLDDADQDNETDQDDVGPDSIDLAPDLVPLLPAARTARDELVRDGRTVSRDALARRLRRNGHAIRNNRVSELLNALRREQRSLNGAQPSIPTHRHHGRYPAIS